MNRRIEQRGFFLLGATMNLERRIREMISYLSEER
jgi:hypothetical protein